VITFSNSCAALSVSLRSIRYIFSLSVISFRYKVVFRIFLYEGRIIAEGIHEVFLVTEEMEEVAIKIS